MIPLAYGSDLPNSQDPPHVSRYQGCEIVGYRKRDYDQYILTLNAAARLHHSKTDRGQTFEGAYTGVAYTCPAGRSPFEVLGNYEQALKKGGFSILYRCYRNCGPMFAAQQIEEGRTPVKDQWQFWDEAETGYLAAKLGGPTGGVHVAVLTATNGNDRTHPQALVEVLERKTMEGGKVIIDAASLQASLAREGKVALYGIYFDTGQAQIKQESKSQLDEIAKLLLNRPSLKILIVGHTDDQGSLEMNDALSRHRAKAVSDALTGTYKIESSRLVPVGVGMASPVASNASEAGRAKNRRVEIVEK
jgi:outer membrane protein OmpA-like peptidoglycan-associated protein